MSHRTRAVEFRIVHHPLNGHTDDVSGYGNNGDWRGTGAYAENPFGRQCAEFDQASYISHANEIIGDGAATVCAWVNLDDFGENTLGRIVNNGNFDLWVNDTNDTLDFSSDGGGTTLQSANNAIKTNRWIHVTVSRDADGTARLYINAVLSASGASGTPAAGTNLIIGNDVPEANAFDGKMFDVQVFNVPLTRDEVADVMRGHG